MPLVAVSDLTKTYVVGQTEVPALRGVSQQERAVAELQRETIPILGCLEFTSGAVS
jgi:hypothetical protein